MGKSRRFIIKANIIVKMNEWISVNDRLPNDGQTVIIFDGYIHIAKFERGISLEERIKMRNGEIENPIDTGWNRSKGYFKVKRSESYSRADEYGNNLVPYCWVSPSETAIWCGQTVKYWMPLPKSPKDENE